MTKPPTGIVIVTIDKAGDEIIRIMNESQLPYIHDPKAPRFLLMDKQGKLRPRVSEGMSVPPASMILEVLWMILTLFLPTFQAVVKSKIQFLNGCQYGHYLSELSRTHPAYWVTSQSIQPEISEKETNIPATECLYVIPKYNGGIYLRRFHGLRRPPLHH